MKRLTGTSIAALALSLILTAPPALATVDNQGPPCTNLQGGGGTAVYSGTAGSTATLSMTASVNVTGTPSGSCTFPAASYTLHVLTAAGGTEIPNLPVQGNGTTSITFSISITNAPGSICIFLTSQIDGHVADRAPNVAGSCVTLTLDGGPPGGDWAQ